MKALNILLVSMTIIVVAIIVGCSGERGEPVAPYDQEVNQDVPIECNPEEYYPPEDEFLGDNIKDFFSCEDDGCIGDPDDFAIRILALLSG